MAVYEIWSEGYVATGESGGATMHGTISGDSFPDACSRYAKANPEFAKYFDAERLTYWGCRLFDSQDEAVKSFG